ncbi:hypothetical protein [Haladaptatus sp. NG-SE-30]
MAIGLATLVQPGGRAPGDGISRAHGAKRHERLGVFGDNNTEVIQTY